MPKTPPTKLINTEEFVKRLAAEGLKRTPAAITKAVRTGRLGDDAVQRGPRGELLFRYEVARDAFRRNTDTTRARPEHLAGMEPTRRVAKREVAPDVDPALAAAADELTAASLIDLYAKLEALPGFAELDDLDVAGLHATFNAALVAWNTLNLPVSDAPWPPPHDPAYVARVTCDD